MNDISWSAEVQYHWDGATCESFKNHARTIVTKGWKHEYIGRSQVLEDFRMAQPAAEDNRFLDPQIFSQLLKPVPLRPIADHGKAGQVVLQQGCSCAQSQIASLPRNQTANKNQFKFGARFRA